MKSNLMKNGVSSVRKRRIVIHTIQMMTIMGIIGITLLMIPNTGQSFQSFP